ncbi:2Fe-2S ferredoxin [Arthrobacter globiformis NBRC 12137]|uniref:2Fe-2S ferredoxin n=1 Tax=Arthrobacter globiformis (strain ATCC 8010 / DSM 20124 / JCM 1332 / NBRC 12137 / NCIMB 8907 / NRRL B-2979 / 168) TaxID=1077972 RepID=H0QKV8_ARTG1|nr:2Fe-2S iron-sulfur cluster-binding protein [Arthrobacter globiformis]GAB13459.1 2Fe-2S ferredoxin [Arthrobacter globiformis NBRC 12137]
MSSTSISNTAISTKLTVVDREGATHDLEWEPGQSMMEALRDNDLPVLASCGGTASCATCHVFLEQEVFDTLEDRSEDELELLVEAEGYRECGSRLSCQVGFSRDLDGVTVTLAPEE